MLKPEYLYRSAKRQQADQVERAARAVLLKRSRQRTRQGFGSWLIRLGMTLQAEEKVAA